ncbi:alpha/beta hydrolase fold domain-containing protein [Streptomyces sp. 11x1]|uniref:alpha/beta hydrolase n=1 Tax=Streptomyces sp. 11x1 TaxID=3038642 RepID=UPI00292DFCBD|nr:alpha/beta hydrolase fold domain-containing protein [Streptomyces sp. 11x1]WNZ06498.1 alpha/beta hydrolase fold domain-containing protein [Streptomyces sp. 11x1]
MSPHAAPARAKDLSGLPRAYLDTGSVETFRDEILAYAGRPSEAGVSVDLHMWGGGFHGFDGPRPTRRSHEPPSRDDFIRRAL